jgi:hypothetical protein
VQSHLELSHLPRGVQAGCDSGTALSRYALFVASFSADIFRFLPTALYLHDLTFIEDGNPDYMDEAQTLINFTKMRMIAAVFTAIEKYQEKPYPFLPVPPVADSIVRPSYAFFSMC